MDHPQSISAMRRAALRKLALTGALGTGGMLALLREALAANPDSGMHSVTGEVTIDGQPAVIGQRILPAQTIATQAGSEAVFVIGANAFLLRESSTFRIDRRSGVVALRYLSGKILSVFGKGNKTLLTPNATIGIRGTGCYIEVEPARTYFCLCYGRAVVTPHANAARKLTLHTTHHEHPLYIGAEPSVIQPATVDNHRDTELIMLEQLVGRLPPFYGKDYAPY
jgi:hypothetical protein